MQARDIPNLITCARLLLVAPIVWGLLTEECGLALLHSRNPDSYLFETSFLALGRSIQQIPFGAPDGQPTDLFFLIGCPDDRMHLHALARLCLMAQKTTVLADLRQAADAEAMCDCIIAAEQAVLASRAHSPSSL